MHYYLCSENAAVYIQDIYEKFLNFLLFDMQIKFSVTNLGIKMSIIVNQQLVNDFIKFFLHTEREMLSKFY